MTAAVAQPTFASVYDGLAVDRELSAGLRLVPRGEPLPDPAAAVAFIRAHLERWEVTPAALAAALDVRSNVVETLLKSPERIADGPRHTLLRDAETWCRGDAHERELRRARVAPSAVVRLIAGIARTVRVTKTVGLIVGSSGLGKSRAIDGLRSEPGGAVVVRADPQRHGAGALLRGIGEGAFAAGDARVAQPSIKGAIQGVRAGGSLVVIDEAHRLAAGALDAAREVFDGSGVGMLLVGTATLGHNVSAECDPLLSPLLSRVALRLDLDSELLAPGPDGKPRQWIDAPTVKAIIARHVSAAPDREALAVLVETANYSAGHLRAAVNAAKVASVLRRRGGDGGAETIGADAIRAALQLAGVKT